MKSEITKDMMIGEVVKKYPDSAGIMFEHGLECVGCHIATWETIEQGAQSHGVDIEKLMQELNKKVNTK
jgi:hybrid cluster-associated redox disulfide protein